MYSIPWTTEDVRPKVKTGDVYEVIVSGIRCRSGFTHNRGEVLEVLHETLAAPFDEIGPYGYNWWVKTKHDNSVWATLESCIERGLLKKV